MIPPTLRLSTFYQDIHNWIITGESPFPFESTEGLCENLKNWIYHHHDGTFSNVLRIQDEMVDEFLDAGRDSLFPFNKGNPHQYHRETESNTIYQNPDRLEWIHTHATKVGSTS